MKKKATREEVEEETRRWAFMREFNRGIREREEAARVSGFYTFPNGERIPWWGCDAPSDIDMALKTFQLSQSATTDDIKKRYRELARQFHPDTGGDETKFKELNNANTVLMKWRET